MLQSREENFPVVSSGINGDKNDSNFGCCLNPLCTNRGQLLPQIDGRESRGRKHERAVTASTSDTFNIPPLQYKKYAF